MLSIILPSYHEPKAYKTLSMTRKLFPDAQIIISPDDKGRGKGWAVRKGIMASKGDVIVLLDADMNIHPRMIKRLLPFLDDFDIVVGAKNYTGMPYSRRIITLLSRVYIKIMFGLPFTTQTGIKAMKKEVILYWENMEWMFDLEFLTKAYRKGCKIIEVPVIANVTKSKSIKILWKALIDSLKIWWRLNYGREGVNNGK